MIRIVLLIFLAGSLFSALKWNTTSAKVEVSRDEDVLEDDLSFHNQRNPRSTSLPGNLQSIIAHIVPQSHCDAAYKKTFDEYYETEVRNVLNSILPALQKFPSRRFAWAETSYLVTWWKDRRTTKEQKRLFQNLIIQDQIEIVNGGWVMHDEAVTRYDSQIHQMIEGHDRLQQLFVDDLNRPNVSILTGWQIDPFGASSFSVNLHAWAGMDFMVLNRIPKSVKDKLKANKTLQFYWETPQASILVNYMDTHYASPKTFDWESADAIPIAEDNVRERSDTFCTILRERAGWYRTPHILVPVGGDFTFQNATLQFQNMDRIMDYIRVHPERYQGIEIQYSTPRQYKEALLGFLDSKNVTLPRVQGGGSFQPLWTGYYFQLPNLKQMLRASEVVLRTCEVRLFQALGSSDASWDWLSNLVERIKAARKTLALMQHHDAITATSYRFVIADYMQRLSSAYNDMSDVLTKLVQGQEDDSSQHTHLSSWSKGSIVGGGSYIHETVLVRETDDSRGMRIDKIVKPQMGVKPISLVVLNSLPQQIDTLVHFVCTRPDVALVVRMDDGSVESIPSQATPLEHEFEVANLGMFLISFRTSVPGLGKRQYQLQVCDLTWTTEQHPAPLIPSIQCADLAKEMLEEELLSSGLSTPSINVQFDETNLDLASFSMTLDKDSSTTRTTKVTHDLMLYDGGEDTPYGFKTNVESSDPPPLLGHKKRRLVSAYHGTLFSQVTLEFTPWLSVRYRTINTTVASENSLLQVTMLTGQLPLGVNLASRFQTDWANTDWVVEQNGFLPVQSSYNSSVGVGNGNTRPLVTRSWLDTKDRKDRLTVFSVDPRAIVSKKSGQLDVFWHRRNNYSQASWKKGVHDWWKEGDDKSTVRSSVWLSLSANENKDNSEAGDFGSNLSNDLVLVSTGGAEWLPDDKVSSEKFGSNLHIVSLRVSEVDRSLKPEREEAWVDLQVENLSDGTPGQIDVAGLFGNSSNLLLNAVSLHSLTYLSVIDKEVRGKHTRSAKVNAASFDCSIEASDGGRVWLLKIGPRRICSIRVPVSPLLLIGDGQGAINSTDTIGILN